MRSVKPERVDSGDSDGITIFCDRVVRVFLFFIIIYHRSPNLLGMKVC